MGEPRVFGKTVAPGMPGLAPGRHMSLDGFLFGCWRLPILYEGSAWDRLYVYWPMGLDVQRRTPCCLVLEEDHLVVTRPGCDAVRLRYGTIACVRRVGATTGRWLASGRRTQLVWCDEGIVYCLEFRLRNAEPREAAEFLRELRRRTQSSITPPDSPRAEILERLARDNRTITRLVAGGVATSALSLVGGSTMLVTGHFAVGSGLAGLCLLAAPASILLGRIIYDHRFTYCDMMMSAKVGRQSCSCINEASFIAGFMGIALAVLVGMLLLVT